MLVFIQLEQQADQDARAAKSDDVKDSSHDCCQLNPSSAEESYFFANWFGSLSDLSDKKRNDLVPGRHCHER